MEVHEHPATERGQHRRHLNIAIAEPRSDISGSQRERHCDQDKPEQSADALDTDVELVHASDRELAQVDLTVTDFPLVRPFPVVNDTIKLAALGWESTFHAYAIARTVDEHVESDRTGRHHGPEREAERRAIDGLTTYSCTDNGEFVEFSALSR